MEENKENLTEEAVESEKAAEETITEDKPVADQSEQPSETTESTDAPDKENAENAGSEEQAVSEETETPVAEETPEGEGDGQTPEEEADKKADIAKKIKIGVVAAGGVFIIIAALYAASLMGGKNTAIDKENPVIPVAIPTEEPEKVTYAPITPQVVEEEPPVESILGVVQGNARYDECVYADGGTVLVRKGELYGAIDYEGKEIVPLKYAQIEEYPTKEGMFALSNSKTESVTKEQDGTTYSYEEVTTTYTLFDNTGKKLYEGNDAVLASGSVFMLAKEDPQDARKNRIEYYKLASPSKAFLVLYVNDQFSMNGFKNGITSVMGFTAVPTEDQDTNPTNLFCGTMDEKGKVTWFAKVPGIDEFDEEVAKWKEENKVVIKKTKKSTTKKKVKEKKYDEDGNEIEDDESIDDEENTDEEENDIDQTEEEKEDEELTDTDTEEKDETEEDENEIDVSAGPVYHMNEILNAPNGGYFVYKDLLDVEDSYSWYTDKGVWYADLDTAFMKADQKKGFVLGNFNNGAVEAKGFIFDGEKYYNLGPNMVLKIGDRDVLIDISKGQGMTVETLTDKIVLSIHEEINICEADYWMYRDGNKYGYIDRKGKETKDTYDDATSFVNGYALVIKEGKAVIIDDQFKEVEEIGAADDVDVAGDVFSVSAKDGIRRYMLKTLREDPTGTKTTSSGAKTTPEADVTPDLKDKKNK